MSQVTHMDNVRQWKGDIQGQCQTMSHATYRDIIRQWTEDIQGQCPIMSQVTYGDKAWQWVRWHTGTPISADTLQGQNSWPATCNTSHFFFKRDKSKPLDTYTIYLCECLKEHFSLTNPLYQFIVTFDPTVTQHTINESYRSSVRILNT